MALISFANHNFTAFSIFRADEVKLPMFKQNNILSLYPKLLCKLKKYKIL